MRRLFLAILFLLSSYTLFGQTYYQVNVDVLNVRSSESQDAGVIGKLSLGDSVYVVTYKAGWSEVKLNETETGYVASKYLSSEFKTYSNKSNKSKLKAKEPTWPIILILGLSLLYGLYKHFSRGSKKASSSKSSSTIKRTILPDKLKCKYCGKDFIGGFSCHYSPTKIHIALSNGKDCVYCGKKFIAGFSCHYSPSKIHRLDT